MDIAIADAGTLRKQITLTCPAAEIDDQVDTTLGQYARQANVKGFRPGKTPKGLLKKRYGAAARADAVEKLIDENVRKAIADNELQPIGPFSNDEHESKTDIKHVISFDVRPSFDLPEPDSISLSDQDTEVTEDEVTEELEAMAKRSGETAPITEGNIAKDDTITLTGTIKSGDETVRDIHDLNHLVGAYPLFGKDAEEIIKLAEAIEVGGTLSFDTVLPKSFTPEEWADKPAQVEVVVQQAQRQTPAEINDELASKMGATTVDELKERINNMISSRKEDAARRTQGEELFDALKAQTSFELPPKLVEDMIEDSLKSVVERETSEDKDADAVRAENAGKVKEDVETHLQRILIMDGLADKYDVQASQEDLNQQIFMAAYQSGRKPEEVAKQLQESGRIYEVMSDIRQHKAIELFLDKVLGKDDEDAEETDQSEENETATVAE